MKTLKKRDIISSAVFQLGAVLFGFGCKEPESLGAVFILAGAVIVFISIIIALVKIRCPFCKHYLGMLYDSKRTFCPYCGAELDEEHS